MYPIKDEADQVSDVILIHEDVTEKKYVEDAIRQIAVGGSATSGRLFFRRLVQQLAKLFGADYAFIGMLAEDNPYKINTLAVCAEIQRTGKATEPTEYTFKRRDGTQGTCISTMFALPNANGQPHFVHMDMDITKHKRAEAETHHMAYQDSLTGLANRRSLQEHLERALENIRVGAAGAMLLIDLDHFKTINDALGHNVGDEILCAVARRPSDTVGDCGFLARLGGDEFVVVMEDLVPDEVEAAAAADALARQIATRLADPIVLNERVFNVGVSLGAALFQNGNITVSNILRYADMALVPSQKPGARQYPIFPTSLASGGGSALALGTGTSHRALEQRAGTAFPAASHRRRSGIRCRGAVALAASRPGRGLRRPSSYRSPRKPD